jgi:predicted nucleic acid-binding protein
MKTLRIYIDTSVIGGCYEPEFAEASGALIKMAVRGEVVLILSNILAAELARAPEAVQAVLASVPDHQTENVEQSGESEALRDAYLSSGVVGAASAQDAHHVALATVSRADVIVSWNFRHIVHIEKIRGFNAVNLREGYGIIEIRTPKEVAHDRED